MKFEIIIPLIGILIGWSLNEVGQLIKAKREDRRIISVTIFMLNEIIFILENKKNVLESALELESHPAHSAEMFANLYRDDSITTENFREKLESCISNVAKFDPYLSLEIKLFSEGIQLFKNYPFDQKNIKETNKEIAIKKKAIELWITLFKRISRKLSFRHSFSMFIKSYFERKRLIRNDRNPYSDLVGHCKKKDSKTTKLGNKVTY